MSGFRLAVYNERYMLTLWATAFYLLENYSQETRDSDFPAQVLQVRAYHGKMIVESEVFFW